MIKEIDPGRKKNIENILYIWISKFAVIIASIISIPLILKYLGKEALGLWLITLHISRGFQLLEIGVGSSLGRLLAKRNSNEKDDEKIKIFTSTLFILITIGLVLIIMSPLITSYIKDGVDISHGLKKDFNAILLIALAYVSITLPMKTGIGILISFHQQNKIAAAEMLVQIFWVFLLIKSGNNNQLSILELAIIYYISFLLKSILIFLMGFKTLGWPTISIGHLKRKYIYEIVSLGGSTFLLTATFMAFRQGMPLMAAWILNVESIILVSIPLMIVFGISPMVNALSRVAEPIVSGIHGNSQETRKVVKIKNIYNKISVYGVVLGVLPLIIFYYYGTDLLHYWLNGRLNEVETDKIWLNTLIMWSGFIISIPGNYARAVLGSTSKHWLTNQMELINVTIGIATSYVLLTKFHFEDVSISIGVFITFLLRGLSHTIVLRNNLR